VQQWIGTADRRLVRFSVVLLVAVSLALGSVTQSAFAIPGATWAHLLGSTGEDTAQAVAVDAHGAVYAVGTSTGQLPLSPNAAAGVSSAFVARYTHAGKLTWVRELGVEGATTRGLAVATSPSGIYIAGSTTGPLGGSAAHGLSDAFVASFDARGQLRWVRTFGGSGDDSAFGVSVDPVTGDVILAGNTEGSHAAPTRGGESAGFLAAFTRSGHLGWAVAYGAQVSKEPTNAQAFAVDCGGQAFLGGQVLGTSPRSWLASYSTLDGSLLWDHSFGSATKADAVTAATTDCLGNVFVSGNTTSHPNMQRHDKGVGFFAELSEQGDVAWTTLDTVPGGAPGLIADPGNDALYTVAASSWSAFRMSDGTPYTSVTFDGQGVIRVFNGALSPSGELNIVGYTDTAQAGAPETYAGGPSDALILQAPRPPAPSPG
jgi:hypothetical protein